MRLTVVQRRVTLAVLGGGAVAMLGSCALGAPTHRRAAPASGAPLQVPAWAFPLRPPGPAEVIDSSVVLHMPGSQAVYTYREAHDFFAPADWRPDTHPPMPGVVARGRRPTVYACG